LLRGAYNASIDESLLRLARIAEEDRDFFDTLVREAVEADCEFFNARTDGLGESGGVGARIDLSWLAETHPAIRHRLIRGIFAKIGLVQDIEMAHIAAADRLIEAGKTGKSVDFPAGYRLEISYDKVIFREGPAPVGSDEIYALNLETLAEGEAVSILFRSSGLRFCFSVTSAPLPDLGALRRDARVLALDFDALREAVSAMTLRTRRAGDRVNPEGMDGGKKLQDLFVDMKIPRGDRERIALLAAGDEILWVPEKRKTRRYAVGAGTKRVLLARCEPGSD
jgi:tRNA(Ile)-lysidine synthase